MIGNNYPTPHGLSEEEKQKVRNLYDAQKKENTTHQCQVCSAEKEIDDYQKHTPSWCDYCGQIRTFEKLK